LSITLSLLIVAYDGRCVSLLIRMSRVTAAVANFDKGVVTVAAVLAGIGTSMRQSAAPQEIASVGMMTNVLFLFLPLLVGPGFWVPHTSSNSKENAKSTLKCTNVLTVVGDNTIKLMMLLYFSLCCRELYTFVRPDKHSHFHCSYF
jgi:hypothetical protein